MLHLLDSHFAFAYSLFDLSASYVTDPSIRNDRTYIDNSWPFMCVSIMFTREAIQACRRGDLNKKMNKRQDILSVLHDFHHGCFYEFAKKMIAAANSGKKAQHHAMYLKEVTDYCQSNPAQLMRNYRQVVKSAKSKNDDFIGYKNASDNAKQSQISKPAEVIDNFDILEDDEDIAPSQVKTSTWTNTSRANKYT